MPNNDDKNKTSRKINALLDYLDKQTSDIHRRTYFGTDTADNIYSLVSDDLDDAIRRATDGDPEYQNVSNITRLLQKITKDNNASASSKLDSAFGTGTDNDISNLFQNNEMMASLMDTYAKTKWIVELDNEFDIICKYMPKLQAALDIKRDAVLCSDSYSKEFLTIQPKNTSSNSDTGSIQENIRNLKRIYKLEENVEKWYEDTAKYGEEFVYCVPYDLALKELLKRKGNTSYQLSESVDIRLKDILRESGNNIPVNVTVDNKEAAIHLNIDKSKIISEAIDNNYYLRKHSGDDTLRGLSESFVINETGESFDSHIKKKNGTTGIKFDRTIDDELKWEDDDNTANDGLTTGNKERDVKLKVNGSVLKTIRHDRCIPIYIEDMMFGVYYIRYDEDESIDRSLNTNVNGYSSISSMFNNGIISGNQDQTRPDNEGILKVIAGKISQEIDAAFINANADLKKEIYLMLKYNDRFNTINKSLYMNVTFIPADDIHHLKFREDPETHRGVSDLWNSLVSAKQWIMLNVTSILGWTTRGFDRRIYYVKQSLDTNTAQSLLNVINTIKKGNFGIRQLESVNNILGILGRFNDFVIPTDSSGTAPIVFDTQPGQQFDFPQELMQQLEESAVNATDVPIEIVNSSTGMDFAVRYTMTNAKLLRNVLKRQYKIETFVTEVVNKLYKFEYNDNVELEVILPPPAFLSMTQGSQLLQSATQYADAIVEVEMANESDQAKAAFKKAVIRKLAPTYLNDAEIENIKDKTRIDASIQKSQPKNDEY